MVGQCDLNTPPESPFIRFHGKFEAFGPNIGNKICFNEYIKTCEKKRSSSPRTLIVLQFQTSPLRQL